MIYDVMWRNIFGCPTYYIIVSPIHEAGSPGCVFWFFSTKEQLIGVIPYGKNFPSNRNKFGRVFRASHRTKRTRAIYSKNLMRPSNTMSRLGSSQVGRYERIIPLTQVCGSVEKKVQPLK